ncbi:hypothetical protein MHAE_15740 [Mycobacterium haemophilum DSM 44634]
MALRAQRLLAFELQARAILGVPVDTIMVRSGRLEYVALTYSVPKSHASSSINRPSRYPP